MAKDLRELESTELTDYEKAEVIVNFPFYVGVAEAHDLVRMYSSEELNNMYIIGNIIAKYPQLLDD